MPMECNRRLIPATTIRRLLMPRNTLDTIPWRAVPTSMVILTKLRYLIQPCPPIRFILSTRARLARTSFHRPSQSPRWEVAARFGGLVGRCCRQPTFWGRGLPTRRPPRLTPSVRQIPSNSSAPNNKRGLNKFRQAVGAIQSPFFLESLFGGQGSKAPGEDMAGGQLVSAHPQGEVGGFTMFHFAAAKLKPVDVPARRSVRHGSVAEQSHVAQ